MAKSSIMKPFRKLLSFIITAVILLNLNACEKDKVLDCTEHDVAPCNEDPTKVNLRIRNVSDYNFCNVSLNPSPYNVNYGIIKEGETTCYRPFDFAYSYGYVELHINGELFVFQPIDFFGEVPLNTGSYTYSIDVIDYDKRRLSIELN